MLRDDDITLKEAETLLDDKYEVMKKVQGWTEEGDELALLVGKPQYKETFKGQCGYCSKCGHNMADCCERKVNLENKENGQGKFKPNQNKKPIWKQGDQTGKRNLIFQGLNVSTVTNMDTLLKIAPTRKIRQT